VRVSPGPLHPFPKGSPVPVSFLLSASFSLVPPPRPSSFTDYGPAPALAPAAWLALEYRPAPAPAAAPAPAKAPPRRPYSYTGQASAVVEQYSTALMCYGD